MQGNGNLYAEEHALAFQQGDESALAFFFGEFHPSLTLFAFQWVKNRQIAQDIASEAFVKTWRMHWKLDTYTGIRAYLYKTVRRDSQLAQRREKRRAEVHNFSELETFCSDTPFQHLVRSETYRLIHAALKTLSPGYRKVITMHFIDGKSTGEIARELNAPLNTIKAQKLKGLRALRKTLLRPILFLFYLCVKFSLFLW